MGEMPVVARAAKHMWEEPCISGEGGSGTIFFSGCPLKCIFFQNRKISAGGFGREITPQRLREIFFELAEEGVHNINLVNPTHFAPAILQAMQGGMPLPVVYNTGGYDSVDTLRMFQGKVQIYLPDMKYALSQPAGRYSGAPDYPETAKAAIKEMFRQTGSYEMDESGILRRGVIIRHLILPENLENTYRVIDWVAETFRPGQVLFSLMSQYTPWGDLSSTSEIDRRLTQEEYDSAMEYLGSSGIEDGFFQELSSAKEEYTPDFDLTGV
jgi:putative pyruvate formate lyase activating enzyme